VHSQRQTNPPNPNALHREPDLQMTRGRGDESEGEGDEEDDAAVNAQALPAVYHKADLAGFLQDVKARTQSTRSNGRLQMTFPGGLMIRVQVRVEGGGGMGGCRGAWLLVSWWLRGGWSVHVVPIHLSPPKPRPIRPPPHPTPPDVLTAAPSRQAQAHQGDQGRLPGGQELIRLHAPRRQPAGVSDSVVGCSGLGVVVAK